MGFETDPQLKDRLCRLMAFLRDLVAARTRPVRDVSSHERVVWPHTLPDVFFDEEALPGSTVLRANRVTREAAPEVPAQLRPWLLTGRYPGHVTQRALELDPKLYAPPPPSRSDRSRRGAWSS